MAYTMLTISSQQSRHSYSQIKHEQLRHVRDQEFELAILSNFQTAERLLPEAVCSTDAWNLHHDPRY